MRNLFSFRWLPALLAFLLLALPGPALAKDEGAQVVWRLLDYIAVDYRGAVGDGGRIVSQLEYDEMREFTASVTRRLGALPARPERARLIGEARALEAAVARRAPPAEIERLARGLGGRLLAAYPVPLAPPSAPDLARGARLYAEACASCHGADGPGRYAPLRAAWSRRRSPSPTASARRSAACSRSTR